MTRLQEDSQAELMRRLRQKKLEQLGTIPASTPVREAIIEEVEKVEEGGVTSESGSVGMDIGI